MAEKKKSKLNNEVHARLSEYRTKLKKDFFSIAEDYFLIFAVTNKILTDFYADNSADKTENNNILNLWSLAENMDFKIDREDLNIGRHKNLGLILGRLEVNNEAKANCIYLEQNDTITEQQERFAIAYLIGCYLMQDNIERKFVVECAEVRIPQTSAEFNAYIFAAFLLLPPDKFFGKVEEYTRTNERPINQETMLLEISKWAKVPYHFAITSYEYLRVIAGLYNNTEFKDNMISLTDEGYGDGRDMLIKLLNDGRLIPNEFFY